MAKMEAFHLHRVAASLLRRSAASLGNHSAVVIEPDRWRPPGQVPGSRRLVFSFGSVVRDECQDGIEENRNDPFSQELGLHWRLEAFLRRITQARLEMIGE